MISLARTEWDASQVCPGVLVAQSCPTLCNPMDHSPPGSSVHGILKVRILEWVAIPFSRGSSWPRDQAWVSCLAGRFFTLWATREALTALVALDHIIDCSKYSYNRYSPISVWLAQGITACHGRNWDLNPGVPNYQTYGSLCPNQEEFL